MSPLNVPLLRGDFAVRFNHQHAVRLRVRIFQCTDLAIELVAHYPDGLLTHCLRLSHHQRETPVQYRAISDPKR